MRAQGLRRIEMSWSTDHGAQRHEDKRERRDAGIHVCIGWGNQQLSLQLTLS